MIINRFCRFLFCGLIAGVATVQGCQCGDDTKGPFKEWSCEVVGRRPGPNDVPCGGSERFVRGTCEPARCDIDSSGCCPGMICNAGGACQVPPSRFTPCTSDTNCDVGQHCLDRPEVNKQSKTCGYLPVTTSGECPDGGQPFNQRCVEIAPCQGGCSGNQVCNIDTNTCEDPPVDAPGCDTTCPASQLLVYSNPDSMLFAGCCAPSCECLTLPPLQPGVWGKYSDAVLGPTHLYVSAYNVTYGDLVVSTHGKLSGESQKLEFIDGFPSTGPVVADPNGPRGGRSAPDINVGEGTSIALQNNELRVAYYDSDHGNLKYAAYDAASQSWAVSVVDDGNLGVAGDDTGDVGRYVSLLIDNGGLAHIAYYGHRFDNAGVRSTGVLYARALNTFPSTTADWEHAVVESLPSCDFACASTQQCVWHNNTPTCLESRNDCATNCACDQSCVSVSGLSECRRTLPQSLSIPCGGECTATSSCVADTPSGSVCLPNATCTCATGETCVDEGGTVGCRRTVEIPDIGGLPQGLGLFVGLRLHNNTPALAYYDNMTGHLRGALANFAFNAPMTTFNTAAIVCSSGDDVGQHLSFDAQPAGAIGIAYQENNGAELWYYGGPDLFSGSRELIDDGVRNDGIHRVGAYSSLRFADNGELYVVYADNTGNDLLAAFKRTTFWEKNATPLLFGGAYGDFAKLTLTGTIGYVTTYQRARDQFDNDRSHLVLQIISLVELAP